MPPRPACWQARNMAETRSFEPPQTLARPRADGPVRVAYTSRDGAARGRPSPTLRTGHRTARRVRTLGADLEELRLSHRHARLEHVLEAMHELARGHGGAVPAPLAAGIDDFRGELTRVARRLRELRADPAGFYGHRSGNAHDDDAGRPA